MAKGLNTFSEYVNVKCIVLCLTLNILHYLLVFHLLYILFSKTPKFCALSNLGCLISVKLVIVVASVEHNTTTTKLKHSTIPDQSPF